MTGMLFIFAACSLWAVDTLIRYPLFSSGVSATQIVFFEHLLLVIAMLVWHAKSLNSLLPVFKKHWFALLLIGGLGSALGTLAFTQAFAHINPTLVILLQKLQPIVAILAAAWILGERWRASFPIWASLALGGTLIMMYPDLKHFSQEGSFSGYAGQDDTLMGYGLALLAVCGWGLATVFGRKLCNDGVDAQQLMIGRFIAGLLVMLPLALREPSAIFTPDPSVLAKIAAMALLAGLLGMAFYYRGLQRLPAHIATLCELFFPVAAVVVNWIWLQQAIGWHHAVGAVILTGASILAQRGQASEEQTPITASELKPTS